MRAAEIHKSRATPTAKKTAAAASQPRPRHAPKRGTLLVEKVATERSAHVPGTAEDVLCAAASGLGYLRACDVLDNWVRSLRANWARSTEPS